MSCYFCNGDDFITSPHKKRAGEELFFPEGNVLKVVWYPDDDWYWYTKNIPFKYCPNCGTKIDPKNWPALFIEGYYYSDQEK